MDAISRSQVLCWLSLRASSGWLTPGRIACETGMCSSTISRSLVLLTLMGLVERVRVAPHSYYRLLPRCTQKRRDFEKRILEAAEKLDLTGCRRAA